MNNAPIETYYNGILFRSKNEAKWARFFDLLKINANYEPETVNGYLGIMYKPDFYFPDYEVYGEVKSTFDSLHDPRTERKIGAAIDYQSTAVSKGLLLLGSFPYDVRIIQGLELRISWLFCNKGVQGADANIYINDAGSGGIGLWRINSTDVVEASIPSQVSPNVRLIQNPVVNHSVMYDAIREVNAYFANNNVHF